MLSQKIRMIARSMASDLLATYEMPATNHPMKTLLALCILAAGFAASANAETTTTRTTTTSTHRSTHHMRHHHHRMHHHHNAAAGLTGLGPERAEAAEPGRGPVNALPAVAHVNQVVVVNRRHRRYRTVRRVYFRHGRRVVVYRRVYY